ncbi:hypothetical protein Ancab_037892 [Ancistrocladus abbreviatus]
MDGEGIMKITRRGILLLVMVVCVGYLMMWVMMQTMVYKSTWQPKMQARLNTTYFGTQGPNLVVYTFPVLFVAVAGSIYLHWGTKLYQNGVNKRKGAKKGWLAVWRRPVVVKGPLGIVSGTELAFFFMFIALVVWYFSIYLEGGFSRITTALIHEDGGELWKAKLDFVALGLGLAGNLCLSFLFFPVTRGSSVLPLLGVTSEASIKYHIWLGHLTMLLFTAHGSCYLLLWAVTGSLSEVLKWQHVGVANVPGELALLAGLGLWAATFPCIRRKFFELFFYTHHLYIIFIFFFVLHVGASFMCIMLPGFYLFMIDRCLRFLQSRDRVRIVSARVLPCDILELNFSKSPVLSYTPTSILFVNVPSISKLQWHPYTISSSSSLETEKLSIVVKVEGSWTKKLYEMLASSSLDRLEVSIEGPYGPASTNFLRHDTLVMVSGGSGITPFFSIIRELIYLNMTLKLKTPKLLLICAFKKSIDLAMLDLLPPVSSAPYDLSDMQLQVEVYVTREQELKAENLKQLQTKWFKPHASDAPISPILGQNGWLWLAAIISSSFTGLLLFMGIMTRYYIYPIDHNTNKIFSSATKAVLNILLICTCIAISSSAAVLWNKKWTAMEANHITNKEGITPRATPGSLSYNPERELESLPHQSFIQSTNVHYGERPDLKRLLSDCEGASIGVLVCGPKRMRHEVAAICSSGLADNLHFESISFSW